MPESAASVVRRWMEHRDNLATRWRMEGSPFAVMTADGVRQRPPTINDFAKAHNQFTDLLRAAVREVYAPPVSDETARAFVLGQLADPLEVEAAGELFSHMADRGGWDGDIR